MDDVAARSAWKTNVGRAVKRLYALAGFAAPTVIMRRNPRETIATLSARAFRLDDAIFDDMVKLVSEAARNPGGWVVPSVPRKLKALLEKADGLKMRGLDVRKFEGASSAFSHRIPFREARRTGIQAGVWRAVGNEIALAGEWGRENLTRKISRRAAAGIFILDKGLSSAMEKGIEKGTKDIFASLGKCCLWDAFTAGGEGGCWWTFPDYCFVCEPPSEFHLDERGRAHSETGPAVAWPGGCAAYYWHGVRVPSHVVDIPETIGIEEIERERNIEVRRVLLERYGETRYLLDSGANAVQKDERGELYRKESGIDEPLVFVRVENSTPESDGSRKPYFLRVPPAAKTAREAVAWTFGLGPGEYRPIQET